MEAAREFSKNSQWLLAHCKVFQVVLDIYPDEQIVNLIDKLNENWQLKQQMQKGTPETAVPTTAWFNKGEGKEKDYNK